MIIMKKLIFLFAMMFAVGMAMAQSNDASISTTGDDNIASITQAGLSNLATIEQIADNSSAIQIQNGESNVADLDQKGGWPSDSKVDGETGYQNQQGNNNHATLWQLADEGNGGNDGNQFQDGSNNIAVAWQHTVNATVDQDQVGTNNEAMAFQNGFNGYIKQEQNGIQNIATVDEQGGGGWDNGNSAIQIQQGNWNKAQISQYGTGGAKSAQGNSASITQTGDDNWAGEGLYSNGLFGIYQEGNYNNATVEQNQNVNKSEVFQYGDDNIATVVQNGGTGLFGDYGDFVNKSLINQNGNGNTANVTQTYMP